ncbi:diacylglycerol/lipid kinase family protein [Acetobacter cerevisiae]|uniref:DeoR family transcriptional regulator n=1 Tax=Acetobacter cerevisiae TaxID=178900 RepID=A0A149Q4I7_9PROT|nr:diacylglycerol kinase family protein [Acetobacter cerevisiae]KXU92162.1 DeoR family transcriptional regulator [Acetobacter cerevisiae]GBQ04500.1 diacylglycerol kinase [Acetobacter cerevisiae DSM 14362]
MPDRFVLIHNSRSRRNLKADSRYLDCARRTLGPLFFSPDSQTELHDVIEDMARQDVRCLVVDGGDGTVGNVLSALYVSSYPKDRLPMIAVLPSGNTNLIAADVGFGMRGEEALQRLQDRARSDRLVSDVKQRQPLVVSWPGQDRAPVLGFFGGLGAFTRGIEIAHSPAILKNYAHDTAVLITLAETLRQIITPRLRQSWLDGTPVGLGLNGGELEAHNRFLFLCTGLHCLPHGIWPFWRGGGADEGISYLDVAANPKKLMRAIWSLLRGRSPAWLRADPTYSSGSARQVLLNTEQSFVLDGEVLETGPAQSLEISAGPILSFLQA